MMDFNIVPKNDEGEAINPFAGKINGEWVTGGVSIIYLNKNYGHYETTEEMKNATESEGLKLYFSWLKEKGILN